MKFYEKRKLLCSEEYMCVKASSAKVVISDTYEHMTPTALFACRKTILKRGYSRKDRDT